MKIGIVGVTGYTGGHLAAEALSRGLAVFGLSRGLQGTPPEGVETLVGSIDDDAVRARLFGLVDAVVIAIHASRDGEPFLIDLLPSLLSEAGAAGTRPGAGGGAGPRLGIVGGAGSLLLHEGGPRLLDTIDPAAKNRTDSLAMSAVLEALRAAQTQANWFFVSPSQRYGAHAPGVPTGSYRLGGDILLTSSSGVSEVSGPDFARAVIDELVSPHHHQTRFTVGAL